MPHSQASIFMPRAVQRKEAKEGLWTDVRHHEEKAQPQSWAFIPSFLPLFLCRLLPLSPSLKSLNKFLKTRLGTLPASSCHSMLPASSQCVKVAYARICFTNLSASYTYSPYPELSTVPNTEKAFDKYLLNEIFRGMVCFYLWTRTVKTLSLFSMSVISNIHSFSKS